MSKGNRVTIPFGRLVQTPTGPHILLRTSSPLSSSFSPTLAKQSPTPQSPVRQIIVRSVQPNQQTVGKFQII